MDTSVRSLIVALIVVAISGEESSNDARVCFSTSRGEFCAHLRPAENLTSQTSNLILQMPAAPTLNLSSNRIANLKFQASTIHLIVDPITARPRNFTFDQPAQFKTTTTSNNLQNLILSHNRIRSIKGVFAVLENLQHLDLAHNLIVDIDDAFAECSKLMTLGLNNNLIESLRRETFEHLRSLQSLDLSGNRFTRLNLDILEYLSDLLVLRLNDNFRASEDTFILSAGQRFERLEMAATLLTRIPIALTRSIRELDLSANELVSLQCGEMDSYPLLRTLSLKDNKLTTVEEDSLGRLEYLVELNLHGNRLKQIPFSLPPGLRHLDLGANRIVSVNNTDLQGLANLRVLILNRNRIEYLDEAAFSAVGTLDHLDLSDNPIRVLTSKHFVGLSVVNLQLSNLNRLSCKDIVNCYETFPFTELDRVEEVNLESSPVLGQQLALDQSAQHALGRLRYLNLVNANLTTLNSVLVKNLGHLEKLEVARNPLNCSGLGWLKDWLSSMKQVVTDKVSDRTNSSDVVTIRIHLKKEDVHMQRNEESVEVRTPVCFSPEKLRGKHLMDLKFETASGKKTGQRDKSKYLDGNSIKYDTSKTAELIPVPTKSVGETEGVEKSNTLASVTEASITEVPSSMPEQLTRLKSEELSRESPDASRSVSNSLLTAEKSDEVYYQSDEPEVNATKLRSEAPLKVVKNFNLLHSKDVEYVTTEPIRPSESHDDPLALSLTSSELDEARALKLEVKTINKTHIELSRSGLRKNLNATKIDTQTNSTAKNNGSSDPATTPVSKNRAPGKVPESPSAEKVEHSTETLPTSPKITPKNSSNSSKYDHNAANSRSTVKVSDKNDNKSATEPILSPRGGVTLEPLKNVAELNTTTPRPRKSKTHDERGGSRPARKKQSKKIKQETTIQPGTEPTLLQDTTISFVGEEKETQLGKNRSAQEKTEETQTQDTKNRRDDLVGRGRALITQSEKRLDKQMKNDDKKVERIVSIGNTTLNEKPSNRSENVTQPENKETSRKKNTSEASALNKTADMDVTQDNGSMRGNARKAEKTKENTQGGEQNRSTQMSPSDELLKPVSDGKSDEKNKVMGLAELMGISTGDSAWNTRIETHQTKKASTVKDLSDSMRSVAPDKPQGDRGSEPSKGQLKLNHEKKPSEPSDKFADSKMAGVGGKEELDKGGSHPGMLVFLLIVSVLLFTLSLMLISHWTWCKRLNMYELGDQQILEESDYEINSLTNFKEPERW